MVEISAWSLGWLAVLAGRPSAAEDDLVASGELTARPAMSSDLSAARRVVPSGERSHAPVSMALASGYGYTESVLGLEDSHHRLLGTALLEGAPAPWFGFGFRLDGRYDRHAFAGAPSDDGWTGEPRLYARVDRPIGSETSLGARATFWLPGSRAPSIVPAAITTDLLALLTWSPGAFGITANAGYRLDRSARSAMDAPMLTPGDRLALGVSRFDAALLGLGAHFRRDSWELFGEWSWDLLIGEGAPSAGVSPMRIGVGTRMHVTRAVAFELLGEVSPSGRPETGPTDPLVPVPVRFGLMAGLLFSFGGGPSSSASDDASEIIAKARAGRQTTDDAASAPLAVVEGRIEVEGGLPPDARVVLRRDGEEQPLTPEPSGQFVIKDLAPGPAEIAVEAEGYEPARTEVVLEPGKTLSLSLALKRRLPSGQIRGTVRSFDGRPVAAVVKVVSVPGAPPAPAESPSTWTVRVQGGSFQVDVPPGSYRVTIEAPGYQPQQRTVQVELRGVTVLNADLRGAR
jgi:hypothetical protein